MNEDRFDDWLQDAARDAYNPPAETPTEAMWARIEEARRFRRNGRGAGHATWWRWGAGMAAVLAAGIGIGRVMERADTHRTVAAPGTAAVAPEPGAATSLPFRLAAFQHLGQTEALLVSYQAEARAGRPDAGLAAWSRDLLTMTRLLLDSPAAEDPRLHALLEDLELVLAQIAQLPAVAGEEADLIDQALEQRNVLARLRAAVPAGPADART